MIWGRIYSSGLRFHGCFQMFSSVGAPGMKALLYSRSGDRPLHCSSAIGSS